MNDFTATNGIAIRAKDGDLDFKRPGSYGWFGLYGGQVVDALREFFQAEADERLGRCRSAVDPDFVVYEPREGQPARVLRESTAQVLDYHRSDTRSTHPSAFESAARAYFEARPEPKPQIPDEPRTAWVDKYGTDVWHVGFDGVIRCVLSPSSDPAKYAPFTRLVPAEHS